MNQEWTEPGVFEVAPGVHRIPLPLPNDGLRAVNVYAIEDQGRLVLIDSGWNVPDARDLLDQALAALGSGVGDISRFLITHVHRDHYTQAITIRREFGTPVALGAGEEPALRVINDPHRAPMGTQIAALHSAGADRLAREIAEAVGERPHDDSEGIWEFPDTWIHPGMIHLDGGRVLEAVETPGHTRGHVVFSDAWAGLLFAGDHVLPSITPSIGFEAVSDPNPLGSFLDSLAKVRAMPDARLLPAHGDVTDSVHARVDQLVEHHGRRLDQTLVAVRQGATTGYEVASILKWTRREKDFSDLDPFNAMLACSETLSHLELLVVQERLSVETSDGVRHFSL